MFGGRTKDFYNQVENTINLFDPYKEKWTTHKTTGHPIGIYNGASAALGKNLYHFGGIRGQEYIGYLYQLDSTLNITTTTMDDLNAPMRKSSSKMISHKENLICFGGYGIPSAPHQLQSQFVLDNYYDNEVGWTNELHSFNLKEGEVEY